MSYRAMISLSTAIEITLYGLSVAVGGVGYKHSGSSAHILLDCLTQTRAARLSEIWQTTFITKPRLMLRMLHFRLHSW